ncbi:hypothetical protein AB204_00265 [Xenorhabdus khoisanae]|uniref:Agglutinin C-terminal domain-containing protein n=1 Tax=Xenorhabdus khoisanae TaxID=880157 RepID=A0A0J5FXP4_9GAMM|nr:lectin MOA-related protein [Xenorhabdus khoisanae]KMJ46968.1 hypothetical protein AB204_00265 [Xenorhabdus khoisanae]
MENKDKTIKIPSVSDSGKSTLPESENMNRSEDPISLSQNDSSFFMENDPIPPEDKINPHVSYLIIDDHKRTLCIDDIEYDKKRAYMGSEQYYYAIIILKLRTLKTPGNPMRVAGLYQGKRFFMYAYDTSEETTKICWDTPNSSPEDKRISLKKEYVKTEDGMRKYRLIWNNQGTEMFLYSHAHDKSKQWAWLTASNKKYSLFTLHPHFIKARLIKTLLKKTWPKIQFNLANLRTVDTFYRLVSDEKAKDIYKKSGLENFTYKKQVFDCDDFSLVYKAQACKEAYSDKEIYGYAIGIILGNTKKTAHATNIYITPELKVKIIEPQTGEITDAKDWEYKPNYILI